MRRNLGGGEVLGGPGLGAPLEQPDHAARIEHGQVALPAPCGAIGIRGVRAIGPAVSCDSAIGMMPVRDTSPTVGLSPTMPQMGAGQTIDPSVSVPMPIAARLAAIAAPVPDEDPQGLRSRI